MTDEPLLRQYTRERSEGAFGELVSRHIDLVYATALRMVGGDSHLAQDVTQMVFIHLARNAWRLPQDVVLAGWLHRHTCFTAATTVRTERRRRTREQAAMEMKALDATEPPWEAIAPHLDDALNQLNPADRDAIVLRFLKQQDLRALGAAFGISEDAAQKRVARALERLRSALSRQGVTLTVAALASGLTMEAATAAPAGLALGVTAAALTTSAKTGTLLTLVKLMAATKLKTGLIGVIVAASVLTPVLLQYECHSRVIEQDKAFRQRAEQLAKLEAENQRLAGLLSQAKTSRPIPDSQELLKLRDQVGRLMTSVREMNSPKTTNTASPEERLASLKRYYATQVARLKDHVAANPSEGIPEFKYFTDQNWLAATEENPLETDNDFARALRIARANAEGRVFGIMGQALRRYAKDNNGHFPTELAQLKSYFRSPIDDDILQRYEIVPASSLIKELQTSDAWVITQKAPVNAELDIREALGLTGTRSADERVTNRWTFGQ